MQTSRDFSNPQDFYGVPSGRLPSDEATRQQSGDNVVTEDGFRPSPGFNPANLAHHAQKFYGPSNTSNYNAYHPGPAYHHAQLYPRNPSTATQSFSQFAPHHQRQDHRHDMYHDGGFGAHAQFDDRPPGPHHPYNPYGGYGPAPQQQIPLQYSYLPHHQVPTYHPGYGPGTPQPPPETRRGPRLYPNAVPIMPSPPPPAVPVAPYDPTRHVNLPSAPAVPLEQHDGDALTAIPEEQAPLGHDADGADGAFTSTGGDDLNWAWDQPPTQPAGQDRDATGLALIQAIPFRI